MKPAPFSYHAPRTLADAVAALAEHGADAKVLAGGQSLVPVMAFRLARPQHIIDINEIDALDYIRTENGRLKIGARTRHAAFHESVAPGPLGQLLTAVVHNIAHWPIRVRGTFCGSLAHADAASEWCTVAVTLDADITLANASGQRIVRADDYFQGFLVTDRADDEIIVEASLPLLEADTRFGFEEFSRRAGDYALAMALAVVRQERGQVTAARIGVGGAEPRPRRMSEAEQAIIGQTFNAHSIANAAAAAAAAVDPMGDVQADEAYRRDLVQAMVRRALSRCLS